MATWKELADRMARLSFLTSKSAELKLQEIERYRTPLNEWVHWHFFPTCNNFLEPPSSPPQYAA